MNLTVYLDMTFLAEQKDELLRLAAWSDHALSAPLRAAPCVSPTADKDQPKTRSPFAQLDAHNWKTKKSR